MENLNIYQKLQKCRVELQRMDIKKSGNNKFAGFDYFELADFLPTVNELFYKYNLHSTFCIDGTNALLTIINSEKPEERETFLSPIADASIKGCTPIQSLGGVHTYMKRYLYVNALEITDGDIFDAVVAKPDKPEKPQQPSEREQAINAILAGSKWNISHVQQSSIKAYGKADINLITDEQFAELCEKWKGAVAK